MRAGMPRHFRILTLTRRSAPPSPGGPGGRGTHPYLVRQEVNSYENGTLGDRRDAGTVLGRRS